MLSLEDAREALRLDGTDNDDIIAGLLNAIPDYIELCTGDNGRAASARAVSGYGGKIPVDPLV